MAPNKQLKRKGKNERLLSTILVLSDKLRVIRLGGEAALLVDI